MNWAKVTKNLREIHLPETLVKRVGFYSATYPDEQNRQWVTFDGNEILTMPSWVEYKIRDSDVPNPDQYERLFLRGRIGEAMRHWLNLSVDEMTVSENILLRAFAFWDRRLGKRKLLAANPKTLHPAEIVFLFYRMQAEGMPVTEIDIKLNLKRIKYDNRYKARKKQHEVHAKAAAEAMSKSKSRFDIPGMIRVIYSGKSLDDKDNPLAREVKSTFDQARDPDHLYKSLMHVEQHSKLLGESTALKVILKALMSPEDHIRDIFAWKPSTRNADRQLSSLLRHLWAEYEVPLFLDITWRLDEGSEAVFKGIGRGENIRNFLELLPAPLTKKEAHFFLTAPDTFDLRSATRWAQVQALGGDPRISYGLLDTSLVTDFTENDFWKTVVQFFIDNPMLDTAYFGPIIDYIRNRKFEPQVVIVAEGVVEEQPPIQPNFSMAGREADTLINQVEQWHKELGRGLGKAKLAWQRTGLPDWVKITGEKESKSMRIWRIAELTTYQQLVDEGRAMIHCVASYAQSCATRKSSIWSMTIKTAEGIERCATIQLEPSSKRIVQARGKRNRRLSETERDVLRRWAEENNLTVSEYI